MIFKIGFYCKIFIKKELSMMNVGIFYSFKFFCNNFIILIYFLDLCKFGYYCLSGKIEIFMVILC